MVPKAAGSHSAVPLVIPLPPCRNVLVDDIGAEFLRFCRRAHTADSISACRVVYGNEVLPFQVSKSERFIHDASRRRNLDRLLHGYAPLLDGKRLILGDSEAHHLSLSIEAIEIYVGDHSKGACCVVRRHLVEIAIGEARTPLGNRAGRGQIPAHGRRGRHYRWVVLACCDTIPKITI